MKTRVPIIETKAAIKCGRLRIIGADKAMKQIGMAKSNAYSGGILVPRRAPTSVEINQTGSKHAKLPIKYLHFWDNVISGLFVYIFIDVA